MRVFVTVGTTKFDDLVHVMCTEEIQNVLTERGFTQMTIQSGKAKPDVRGCKLEVDVYDYKSSILEDMKEANLIVSHAGAGTCLEVLELNKKLIVVVNDRLMDNHQTELAEKLGEGGYVEYSSVVTLASVLKTCPLQPQASFPKTDPALFSNFLMKELNMI
eukprot:TRINITY_DN9107_c0_g1_i9.p1 TRINITY_DN9107_c0_g1~~TRINITY_DN9107_c0_g1_i9.p1  ORF type:complete len:172 (-),score=32.63 TRINITY_DN9107_c0_g1_i9:74-556(-)